MNGKASFLSYDGRSAPSMEGEQVRKCLRQGSTISVCPETSDLDVADEHVASTTSYHPEEGTSLAFVHLQDIRFLLVR